MTNSPFTTIALILLMVVAFYFLIIRPQKKRQQAQQKTMSELTPGTRVLLGSGLFGTISWVGSKQAILEVAPGVEMTVLKQAIARTVTPGDEYSEPLDAVDEPDEPTPVVDGTPEAPLNDPTLPDTPVTDTADGPIRNEPAVNDPTSRVHPERADVERAYLEQGMTSVGNTKRPSWPHLDCARRDRGRAVRPDGADQQLDPETGA